MNFNSWKLTVLPPIIGVAANRRGAGKTTFCETLIGWLENCGIAATRCSFADPLRDICADILKLVFEKNSNIRQWLYANKDSKIGNFNFSGRDFMITVAESCRRNLGNAVFAEEYTRRVDLLREAGVKVLTDDVRFPVEVATIKKLGGKILYLMASDPKVPEKSEGAIAPSHCDWTLLCEGKSPEKLVEEFLDMACPKNVIPLRRRN